MSVYSENMSSLSSGLVPLGGKSAPKSNDGLSSISSLGDAPGIAKPSGSSGRPTKFTSNIPSDDSEDDLDALFDDVGKATNSTALRSSNLAGRVAGQGKFKSTMRDLSDSEDNYNAFDDSMSSTGSPMGIKNQRPRQAALEAEISFSAEDLDESILGRLAGSSRASHYDKLPVARGSQSEQDASTQKLSVSESDEENAADGSIFSLSVGRNQRAVSPEDVPNSKSAGNKSTEKENEPGDDSDEFIPSFLEAGRQPRQRRYTSVGRHLRKHFFLRVNFSSA